MKIKLREVYTVTRRIADCDSLSVARSEHRSVQDEIREYLYGGVGVNEKIEVRLEYWDTAHKRWLRVERI